MHNIIMTDDKIYLSGWTDAGFYPIWFETAAMKMKAEEPREAEEPETLESWLRRIPEIAGEYEEQERWLERMGWGLFMAA
ncbi:hypothetical protein BD410DRAFT_823914 [Rickenella mellea]|uniref:Uncharacterized protein n=1 Tax=Rickenella mellea TaxID=50990 RepID=A0A4R5XH33_9AGAM|nr:hypothetical protein BD410DRAFT_823914 [Rickenella mellea]